MDKQVRRGLMNSFRVVRLAKRLMTVHGATVVEMLVSAVMPTMLMMVVVTFVGSASAVQKIVTKPRLNERPQHKAYQADLSEVASHQRSVVGNSGLSCPVANC